MVEGLTDADYQWKSEKLLFSVTVVSEKLKPLSWVVVLIDIVLTEKLKKKKSEAGIINANIESASWLVLLNDFFYV